MRPKLLLVTMTGVLTTAIICSSTLTANAAQTREEAINAQTDMFFYTVNPQLNERKLRSDDYGYIREWNAIRKAVEQEMKPTASECDGQYWELYDYDWNYGLNVPNGSPHVSRSFDRIADAIFYSRHPELAGRPLSSSNSKLAREWNQIRRAIIVEQPCS
ncbi:MAG TPA: hypothetical protein V6D33_09550 [Cyanophyceae cyanobacterium]